MGTATAFRMPYGTHLDRNRERKMVFYGRVSTEHEAQLSALENQIQWYDDQAKYHPNWTVLDTYLDRGITGTQAKKRPAFLKMLEDARAGKFDLIVTREVCRFARNTVDTLVTTRELKNLGIEVYFVEDNIWTMDGDGELRLTIMATLAQEESRKVSERVKAGQYVSREQGVIYGNGNILGYDRVDGNYIVNPDQGETVRMIFDMYIHSSMGCTKISNELCRLKRKNASGEVKWTAGIISRILRNATYMGFNVYGQSFSNNYLEQKRINIHDFSAYTLVKADFEPLVTEEEWRACEKKRLSRITPTLNTALATRRTHAKMESKDVWQRKLRCECGSALRKNRWHKNQNKEWSYGYQCYNQVNNGSARKRRKEGLDDTGFCDMQMIADWKMEAMGKLILSEIWQDRKEAAQLACRMLRDCAVSEPQVDNTRALQSEISAVNHKIETLIEMRTGGEISKDEFLKQRNKLDEELKILETQLAAEANKEPLPDKQTLAWQTIEETLNTLIDFSAPKLHDKLFDKFVAQVIPRGNNRFAWIMNLDGGQTTEFTLKAEGRKAHKQIGFADEGGDKPPVHNIIYLSWFSDCRKSKKTSPETIPHRRLLSRSRRELSY